MIFHNNSLASEAFELVRFKYKSTAITDCPKRYRSTNCPPSNITFGNRHQTTIPGLRATYKTHIQKAKGISYEAIPTVTGSGSVKKNTQFGMINNRANKKYKCSCEDIQRINLVKYFIQSKLCQLSIITILN